MDSFLPVLFQLIFWGLILLFIVSLAKVFVKAGRRWWEAIIPLYNMYVLLKIVGRPGWWLLLFFIPLVSLLISIEVNHLLSKRFGHGVGFTIGLLVLAPIFLPILAFGKSTYTPPEPTRTDSAAASPTM